MLGVQLVLTNEQWEKFMCFNNNCGCGCNQRNNSWNNSNGCGCNNNCGYDNNCRCGCSNPFINVNGCCSRTFLDNTTTNIV